MRLFQAERERTRRLFVGAVVQQCGAFDKRFIYDVNISRHFDSSTKRLLCSDAPYIDINKIPPQIRSYTPTLRAL